MRTVNSCRIGRSAAAAIEGGGGKLLAVRGVCVGDDGAGDVGVEDDDVEDDDVEDDKVCKVCPFDAAWEVFDEYSVRLAAVCRRLPTADRDETPAPLLSSTDDADFDLSAAAPGAFVCLPTRVVRRPSLARTPSSSSSRAASPFR
jgi:hypothetical protein